VNITTPFVPVGKDGKREKQPPHRKKQAKTARSAQGKGITGNVERPLCCV